MSIVLQYMKAVHSDSIATCNTMAIDENVNSVNDNVLLNTNIDNVLDRPTELTTNVVSSKLNVNDMKLNDTSVDFIACEDNSDVENVNICKHTNKGDLDVNRGSKSSGELAGNGRSLNNRKVEEITSKNTPKPDALPTKKSKNCNLPSDGITEKYADKIISNPLGKNILADDDMIRSERSMFNFDIGDINPDVQTVLSNIDVELSDLQRAILTQILTDRMSAFSDVLPKQAARVPPLRIEVIKGRRLKNQKTRRLSSLETVRFVNEDTNKLSNISVIQRSSSPVGSPIV